MLERAGLNIAGSVGTHAKYRGSRIAFKCGDRQVTWGEFDARVNQVANALIKAGLKKGDKAALLSLNCIEALEIMCGVLRAGGVIVPLSPLLTSGQLAFLTQDAGASFFFCTFPLQGLVQPVLDQLNGIPRERRLAVFFDEEGWTPYEDFLSGASVTPVFVDTQDHDEAVIIYSSGTTGLPKGIVHTHFSRTMLGMAGGLEFRIHSGSIMLINTPLFTNATWVMLLGSMGVGALVVLLPTFSPEAFFHAVEQEKITHTFLVPTQYHVILDHPEFDKHDLSSLQIMVSMGSALPLPVKKQILQRMGKGLIELYGLTEGVGTTLKPEEIEAKTGSVGTPISGTEIRIIDHEDKELPFGEIGEIVGISSGLMKGYHNRPDANAEIIWKDEFGRSFIKTGDIGRFDEDGFLYILDRKKDMIVSGGINVFASDIEEVLIQHPDVNEAAVVAIPHEKWGETPLALVIPYPDAKAREDEIMGWVNQRLAKYQRLARVEFRREDFPRNALGKVLKRQLREPYWKDQA
ncbi:Acyl-CoA synthetase (AMP-forming)/AMP-acid ligase II [Desulfatibacillum alkenivorans DSM 16219]|jgi:acyl-CoA synthetase (AMP-forming)/AMP-acid ligase II|uniref:Acyl-CoA synthetase (AMP-forming)/AMP-acid ligase II n=1 Tax=Desulfatibacillum alkenivorans DSM 16219 TaxID=1121393 RepID=A0A1M6IFL6_9BACT|nr:AMP-binding protein [Desulfatibacillum alkenivorans]SHJ33231.1 Acyl-CoA synthetase (AMP-forming)/AMP-acid ligase II [Desulfatibacillum alkenivorans DSM 16219]